MITQKRVISVLLVDDQPIVYQAVKQMMPTDNHLELHYCENPTDAIEQALEISPTVILQDLLMPQMDGLTLVKFFRAHPKLADIPLIVLSSRENADQKAEAFLAGANDYLVKLPDKTELIARIEYHSRSYFNLIERNEAYQQLIESQKKLYSELAQAAQYVHSLLPPPIQGKIQTTWRFIPSTSLGGDCFGYHWLDEQYFAIYLRDVCGHGIGSALLSISVMNTLRSQALTNVDFKQPSQVLHGLNKNFQMKQHNGLFFTIWYGVFDQQSRNLFYASGGHHPAILFDATKNQAQTVHLLKNDNMVIGAVPTSKFTTDHIYIHKDAELFIFSDGAYEIVSPNGTLLTFEAFVDTMKAYHAANNCTIDSILTFIRNFQANDKLQDDFSMLKLHFN